LIIFIKKSLYGIIVTNQTSGHCRVFRMFVFKKTFPGNEIRSLFQLMNYKG